MATAAWPNIHALIEPLIGTPFAEMNCWDLLRHLLKKGWDLDLVTESGQITPQLVEVWWHDSPVPSRTLIQPWDVLVFSQNVFGVTDHCGVVVQGDHFIHAHTKHGGHDGTPGGVCQERLRRKWQQRLVQILRLRAVL